MGQATLAGFLRSFESLDFSAPVTVITSTDSQHPSPYPTSFLSPRSFGHTFFAHWSRSVTVAFDETNASRSRLEWLYDKKFGLQGNLSRFGSEAEAPVSELVR